MIIYVSICYNNGVISNVSKNHIGIRYPFNVRASVVAEALILLLLSSYLVSSPDILSDLLSQHIMNIIKSIHSI